MNRFLLIIILLLPLFSFSQGDDCINAVTITPTFTNCNFQAGSSANATQSIATCSAGGIADDDVWYTFVANSSSTTITVDPTVGYDAVIELFSGTCASLVSIQCEDVNGLNGDEVLVNTSLINGNTYFFRVYHYGSGSGTSTFNVCVVGLAPPTNNIPCNAYALPTVEPSCNFDIYTNLGSAGSAEPTPTGCGGSAPFDGGYLGGDVWFSVVVPPSGELDIHTLSVDFADGAMALYSGACGSLTLVECDDDGEPGDGILMPHIYRTGLVPGSTMYIRVWEYDNNANGQFGICVSTPDNDDCASAQQICDLNGYGGITSSAYTIDQPSNMCGIGDPLAPNPGCVFGTGYTGASPVQIDNNSWLQFTASSTTATLFIQVNNCSNGNGMQMQIFSGTNCTNFAAVSPFLETTTSQSITATGLTPGNTYYIVIDGFAGDICSYTISATSGVQVVEAVTSKSAVCMGDTAIISAVVTGTGSYTYSWSSNPPGLSNTDSSLTISPSQNTLYSVDITGLCGSVTTASVYVTAHTPPTSGITASDTVICENEIVNLNGNPNGGTSPYAHSWTGSGQPFLNSSSNVSPIFSGTSAGNYMLYYDVTDTIGCSANDSISVVVNANPIATISGNDTICNGDTTTLTALGGGTYSWDIGGSNDSIVVSPSTNTSYSVIVTNGNSCKDTANVTVQVNALPTAIISGTTAICQGQSTALTASGGSAYSWNNGDTSATINVSPNADSSYAVTVMNSNGCIDTTSVIVQVALNPIANIGGNDSICQGTSVLLTASGGGTYQWNNGATSPSINMSPNADTTYSVIVDLGGCKDSTTHTITVNPLPIVGITGIDTICTGDTTTLTATGGGIYNWNTGSSSDSIVVFPTSQTNYTVVVTDANNCIDSTNMTVTVNALPTASISGSSLICQGNSTTLTATGGNSYLWNNGANTPVINVSPNTDSTYIVTVTNSNGCNDTSSILVQVANNPTAVITASDSICFGSSITLTASGGGTYQWNNGATSPSINMSPNADTTYSVIVDLGGCTDTTNHPVTVNPLPVVNVTGNTIICNGESTTLTATGGGSYSWDTGSSFDSITVSPSTNTNYIVVVNDANNCIDSSSITVQVNPLPIININGINSICNGDSTTLTASGANSYLWNIGDTTSSINVNLSSNTSYTVIGTDGNNCIDSTQILVTILPQPTAVINGTSTICNGEVSILVASGGSSYLWSTGDTTSTISVMPNDTNTYSVQVGDVGGCSDSTTFTISVTPLPIINAFNDTTIILGQSTSIFVQSGTSNYSWTPSDSLSCTSCASPIANPTETTTYCVETTENGCINSACVTVTVDALCGELFVPNAFSPNGDGNNDCLKVYNNCLETVLFRVYSRWGELIYESENIDDCWDGTNNGSELNTGVYSFTVSAQLINGEVRELKGNTTLFK
jgi:gliding motility-associated-like protein